MTSLGGEIVFWWRNSLVVLKYLFQVSDNMASGDDSAKRGM